MYSGAAHQRGQDLVVVLAATQVARDAVRQLLARRVRVDLEEADGGHDEAGHAEGALEALLVDDRLLHGVQRAVGGGEPLDAHHAPVAHGVRQHRARVVRHVVDEHGARAALGAVAPKLGAGQPQLVAERHGERFLLHDVDASRLAVDVQRDQPLTRPCRRRLAEHGAAPAEHVRRAGRHGAARDHAFDEVATGNLVAHGANFSTAAAGSRQRAVRLKPEPTSAESLRRPASGGSRPAGCRLPAAGCRLYRASTSRCARLDEADRWRTTLTALLDLSRMRASVACSVAASLSNAPWATAREASCSPTGTAFGESTQSVGRSPSGRACTNFSMPRSGSPSV